VWGWNEKIEVRFFTMGNYFEFSQDLFMILNSNLFFFYAGGDESLGVLSMKSSSSTISIYCF
jgi:hypothetical protein